MATYAAMIEIMDSGIGSNTDLKRQGMYETYPVSVYERQRTLPVKGDSSNS